MTSHSALPTLQRKGLVLIALLAAAFLMPFGYRLDLGPGPDGIRAVLWEYLDAPWFSGVRFVRIGQMAEAILYTLPTYFYIYQAYQLFFGQVKRKRMVAVGILCALFPGIISLIGVLGWLQGWTQPPPPQSDPYFPIFIPIPFTILVSLLLMWLLPRKEADQMENA